MRALRLLSFFLLLSGSLFAQGKKTIYTCPMHPEVQRSSPGQCPKCGMDLEKKTIRVKAPPKKKAVTPPKKETVEADTVRKEEVVAEMDMEPAPAAATAEAPPIFTPLDLRPGRVVRFDLHITDTMVNYSGRNRHAYAINGTIPGPDLVFTEGDTAEIYLHNHLHEETSLHWHGVILPNRFDGVPYLTTAPVGPGQVHLYRFAIVQNGTYWYHSHSGLQEQAGIYGALVFKKRESQKPSNNNDMASDPMTPMPSAPGHEGHEGHNMAPASQATPITPAGDANYDLEQTVVLSEWTDEKPHEVQRRLRTANDWYAIQKGSTQSYSEAIRDGHLKTKLLNEWKRMNAMDVSDVFYNRFLINGSPQADGANAGAGKKVRLRIVNAGASSYFWVQWAGGKMTVIANDGNEVVPVTVDRLIVGVSETYDVVVTVAGNRSHEFRATPEDRSSHASIWIGEGDSVTAPLLPRLKYFEGMKMMNAMMKTNGDMKDMGMNMSLQQMDMNSVMYPELASPAGREETDAHAQHGGSSPGITTLNYGMLRSPTYTKLPNAPTTTLEFTLTGNMNRYVWMINDKLVREWDKIKIDKGRNVRIILFNNSMMRHPMHLHGHDFRVVNGGGDYSPLKNVIDIMPMERDTIEFAGNADGDWFFHCHILYHMMAGMGNVFSYRNSEPNPELPDSVRSYNRFLRDQRMFHIMAEVGLESNGSDGRFMVSGDRYEWRTEWRLGLTHHHGNEVETYVGRYLGTMQWLFPFIGFDYHRNRIQNEREKTIFGQYSNQNNRKAFIAGVNYVLPMLVEAQVRIDSKGKLRAQLAREDIPLTPRLRMSLMANTDREYMGGMRYTLTKWLSISTHYDSDMGYGAGVTLIY